jgi:hypothetical protein
MVERKTSLILILLDKPSIPDETTYGLVKSDGWWTKKEDFPFVHCGFIVFLKVKQT